MKALRTVAPAEAQPLQVSKWLKIQVLLDTEEMGKLLIDLGDIIIALTGCVCNLDEGFILKESFLGCYKRYIDELKERQIPDESHFRSFFSATFTVALDHLYAVMVNDGKHIIRACKPVVQLQSHRMIYSPEDGKFRSMVFGLESIAWGIQFSYPQLYQDAATHDVMQVGVSSSFPNTILFRHLQKWMREHTVPTRFEIEGKRMTLPVRIGKSCMKWINRHPQLTLKGFKVIPYEH